MKTRISFVVEGSLNKKEKAYLGNLLADAMEAFAKSRGPTPAEYLDRRALENQAMPEMTPDMRVYKIRELEDRVGLANRLQEQARNVVVEEA